MNFIWGDAVSLLPISTVLLAFLSIFSLASFGTTRLCHPTLFFTRLRDCFVFGDPAGLGIHHGQACRHALGFEVFMEGFKLERIGGMPSWFTLSKILRLTRECYRFSGLKRVLFLRTLSFDNCVGALWGGTRVLLSLPCYEGSWLNFGKVLFGEFRKWSSHNIILINKFK
jgi:hypothetical protein